MGEDAIDGVNTLALASHETIIRISRERYAKPRALVEERIRRFAGVAS